MRESKYCAILHTEDGTNSDIVYKVYGANKAAAIQNIATNLKNISPYTVKSITRINATDRKINKKSASLAFVDMGQCF